MLTDFSLLSDINRSWLYFVSAALIDAGLDVVFQTSDLRTDDGERIEVKSDFVIVSPMNQWRQSINEPGTIEVNFRIGVVAAQKPGEILVGNTRAIQMQAIIQQALYGSERLLHGMQFGVVGGAYAIPLRRFNDSGDPTEVLNEWGIQYGGNIWDDRTPDGSLVQFWVLEIPVTVNT